eukprot:4678802-Pyramimonas_sp.AAC.1
MPGSDKKAKDRNRECEHQIDHKTHISQHPSEQTGGYIEIEREREIEIQRERERETERSSA